MKLQNFARLFQLPAILFSAMTLPLAAQTNNILWDGGFDTGFGNGYWTAVGLNRGPSLRRMWDGQTALRTTIPVGSRVYRLDDGAYALTAWVKRAPDSLAVKDPVVRLTLSNVNYQPGPGRHAWSKTFPVPPGTDWSRVGWVQEINSSASRYFHVELSSDTADVLVDAVCLTAGTNMPASFVAAAPVEAGFDVTEETRIFIDGEPRKLDLRIVNHTATTRTERVVWKAFNQDEEKIDSGEWQGELLPQAVTVWPLPTTAWPWGGYRLECRVVGQPIQGDALVAFLPQIDPAAFPYLGADANIVAAARDFTPRFMQRLGMNTVNALSCSAPLARWGLVNPRPGVYNWQDESMAPAAAAGMNLVLYLQGLAQAPVWVHTNYLEGSFRLGLRVRDEAGFTAAYTQYVTAVIEHYGARIGAIICDDESHYIFESPELVAQLGRIYRALYEAANAAARKQGLKIPFGLSTGPPDWFNRFLDHIDKNYLDFICLNSASRPWWAASCINMALKKGFAPNFYRSAGVGTRNVPRRVSLYVDRAMGGYTDMGYTVWQALQHAWLSRPYGSEDPRDGALVDFGYYDLRLLQQSAYMPISGKTGVEFDNSPALGILAMAMMKYHLQGLRAAREPDLEKILQGTLVLGVPLATTNVHAYAFRDKTRAVIALLTPEPHTIDSSWVFHGPDFGVAQPRDLFAQPLQPQPDGRLTVKHLPLYLHLPAAALPATLAKVGQWTAQLLPAPTQQRFTAGAYTLEIDPASANYLRLLRQDGEALPVELLRGVQTRLPLGEGALRAVASHSGATISLLFQETRSALNISLSEMGCDIAFTKENNKKATLHDTLTFLVGADGAGRDIVLQEGQEVRAGTLRADYGKLFPAANVPAPRPLAPEASLIDVVGFAGFEAPAAVGRLFAPATGLRWILRDGNALLEADYTLQPYTGGGRRGLTSIELKLLVR